MSTDEDIPMPEGNGEKDCPICRGRGVVPIEIDGWPGGGTQNCKCVFKKDLVENVKRIWPVLLTVESVDSSPLLGLTRQNLWITGTNYALRRHLRHVAFRMGTMWDARVIADATLITAWLSTAKNVKDPDVLTMREDGNRDKPSDHFMTLVDLAVPFDLLIIRLGVKAAKNREMPNVLAEAINEREQVGKPTWVVDSPNHRLAPGHICYSDEVAEILDGFRRVILPEEGGHAADETAPYARKTLPLAGTTATPGAGLSLGNYGRKPTAYQEFSMAPGPTPAPRTTPPPDPDDDDEFSVASLMEAAVDPAPTPPPEDDDDVEVPDAAYDPEEALSNYPSAEELNANGTPSWLTKRLLTIDERKEAQRKAKQDKRWGRKGGDKR